mmetsp:Transcript_105436/g.263947  ORF Transcript_105436/g.263947 Transcript_105436/m.263947 type:complete len:452 (+) Transcript_105436:1210-2565(+)
MVWAEVQPKGVASSTGCGWDNSPSPARSSPKWAMVRLSCSLPIFPRAMPFCTEACSSKLGGGLSPKRGLNPKCSVITSKSFLPACCLASGSTCVSSTETLAPGSLRAMEPVAPSICPKPRTSPALLLLLPVRSKRKSCQPTPTSRQQPRERHSSKLCTLSGAACERLDPKTAGEAIFEESKVQRALDDARSPRPEAHPLAIRSASEFTNVGSTHQGCRWANSCQESHGPTFSSLTFPRDITSSNFSQRLEMPTSSKSWCPTWAMRSSAPEYTMSSSKPKGLSEVLRASVTDSCPVALRSSAARATPSTRQGAAPPDENGAEARVSSMRLSLQMTLKSVWDWKGFANPPWCCRSCQIVTVAFPPQANSGHSCPTGVSKLMSSPLAVLRVIAPRKQSNSTVVLISSSGSSEASPPPATALVTSPDGATGPATQPKRPEVTSQRHSSPSPRTAT